MLSCDLIHESADVLERQNRSIASDSTHQLSDQRRNFPAIAALFAAREGGPGSAAPFPATRTAGFAAAEAMRPDNHRRAQPSSLAGTAIVTAPVADHAASFQAAARGQVSQSATALTDKAARAASRVARLAKQYDVTDPSSCLVVAPGGGDSSSAVTGSPSGGPETTSRHATVAMASELKTKQALYVSKSHGLLLGGGGGDVADDAGAAIPTKSRGLSDPMSPYLEETLRAEPAAASYDAARRECQAAVDAIARRCYDRAVGSPPTQQQHGIKGEPSSSLVAPRSSRRYARFCDMEFFIGAPDSIFPATAAVAKALTGGSGGATSAVLASPPHRSTSPALGTDSRSVPDDVVRLADYYGAEVPIVAGSGCAKGQKARRRLQQNVRGGASSRHDATSAVATDVVIDDDATSSSDGDAAEHEADPADDQRVASTTQRRAAKMQQKWLLRHASDELFAGGALPHYGHCVSALTSLLVPDRVRRVTPGGTTSASTRRRPQRSQGGNGDGEDDLMSAASAGPVTREFMLGRLFVLPRSEMFDADHASLTGDGDGDGGLLGSPLQDATTASRRLNFSHRTGGRPSSDEPQAAAETLETSRCREVADYLTGLRGIPRCGAVGVMLCVTGRWEWLIIDDAIAIKRGRGSHDGEPEGEGGPKGAGEDGQGTVASPSRSSSPPHRPVELQALSTAAPHPMFLRVVPQPSAASAALLAASENQSAAKLRRTLTAMQAVKRLLSTESPLSPRRGTSRTRTASPESPASSSACQSDIKPTELWPFLLEKALAKLYGCVEGLHLINAAAPFAQLVATLTGGTEEVMPLHANLPTRDMRETRRVLRQRRAADSSAASVASIKVVDRHDQAGGPQSDDQEEEVQADDVESDPGGDGEPTVCRAIRRAEEAGVREAIVTRRRRQRRTKLGERPRPPTPPRPAAARVTFEQFQDRTSMCYHSFRSDGQVHAAAIGTLERRSYAAALTAGPATFADVVALLHSPVAKGAAALGNSVAGASQGPLSPPSGSLPPLAHDGRSMVGSEAADRPLVGVDDRGAIILASHERVVAAVSEEAADRRAATRGIERWHPGEGGEVVAEPSAMVASATRGRSVPLAAVSSAMVSSSLRCVHPSDGLVVRHLLAPQQWYPVIRAFRRSDEGIRAGSRSTGKGAVATLGGTEEGGDDDDDDTPMVELYDACSSTQRVKAYATANAAEKRQRVVAKHIAAGDVEAAARLRSQPLQIPLGSAARYFSVRWCTFLCVFSRCEYSTSIVDGLPTTPAQRLLRERLQEAYRQRCAAASSPAFAAHQSDDAEERCVRYHRFTLQSIAAPSGLDASVTEDVTAEDDAAYDALKAYGRVAVNERFQAKMFAHSVVSGSGGTAGPPLAARHLIDPHGPLDQLGQRREAVARRHEQRRRWLYPCRPMLLEIVDAAAPVTIDLSLWQADPATHPLNVSHASRRDIAMGNMALEVYRWLPEGADPNVVAAKAATTASALAAERCIAAITQHCVRLSPPRPPDGAPPSDTVPATRYARQVSCRVAVGRGTYVLRPYLFDAGDPIPYALTVTVPSVAVAAMRPLLAVPAYRVPAVVTIAWAVRQRMQHSTQQLAPQRQGGDRTAATHGWIPQRRHDEDSITLVSNLLQSEADASATMNAIRRDRDRQWASAWPSAEVSAKRTLPPVPERRDAAVLVGSAVAVAKAVNGGGSDGAWGERGADVASPGRAASAVLATEVGIDGSPDGGGVIPAGLRRTLALHAARSVGLADASDRGASPPRIAPPYLVELRPSDAAIDDAAVTNYTVSTKGLPRVSALAWDALEPRGLSQKMVSMMRQPPAPSSMGS